MRIERKYHDAARKELEAITKKMQTEENGFSKLERAAFKRKKDIEAESICKEYERLSNNVKKQADPLKLNWFNELCEKAVSVACAMEANIIAEMDNKMIGRIIFESDWVLISNAVDSRIKKIISELFMASTDMIMSFRSGLFHIELLYELYSV